MGGLILLLALSVVMAVASFLAGALPLSMTLSQSQLRLISSIGVGILVGTSLIVIMPEGIEAVVRSSGSSSHAHGAHEQARSNIMGATGPGLSTRRVADVHEYRRWEASGSESQTLESAIEAIVRRAGEEESRDEHEHEHEREHDHGAEPEPSKGSDSPKQTEDSHLDLPTFYIGFSLILGFVLMFLIDRIPRHAVDSIQTAPQTRHISLENLGGSSVTEDEESEGFLGSLAPTPKQSRSLATTTGLVIHAAADGIAMGASATTDDMKLGFIIFVAIMIHKAPAAFGLTSVLLKQGLSKRAARGHLIVFSLAAPLGALSTYMLISLLGGSHMDGEKGQWWTGMLLLFSAGTFLYVAMHAMNEDNLAGGHDHQAGTNGYGDGGSNSQRKQTRPQMRDTLATVGGMLLPLLTQFGHHH